MNPLVTIKPLKWRVQDGYAELIGRYPWELFVTLTYLDFIGEEASSRELRKWLNSVNRLLYGRRWMHHEPCGVYWVCADELQKRGVLHHHLLMNRVQDARRLTLMDMWEEQSQKTGFARIWPVENPQAVSRYLCKYIGKGTEVYFSNNLPDLTADLVARMADPA